MRLVRSIAIAVVLAFALAACGSGGSSTKTSGTTTGSPTATTTAAGAAATIDTGQTGLGTVLVNTEGRTLYHLTKESATNIVCTGPCASLWPPVTVPSGQQPQAGAGVTGTLTVVNRPDGTRQVAVNGYPLYTYSLDQKAGDTKGQGFATVWFALMANGSSTAAAPAATVPAVTVPGVTGPAITVPTTKAGGGY